MNRQLSNKTKGILFILLSALAFAGMNICVRLSGDLPTIQKSFFRNIVAFAIAAIVLFKEGFSNPNPKRLAEGDLNDASADEKPLGLRVFLPKDKRNWPLFLLRSICGTVGILCNFYAVDHLTLSDASMLNKMSPFFAVIASFFILKERFSWAQGGVLVGAFAGLLCIVKPNFSNLDFLPAAIGALGGMGAGFAYTFVRKLGQKKERGSLIVFVFSGFSCLVAVPFLIADFAPMAWIQTLFLLGAGLCAAAGQFSITAAYCHAPAREISVYDYSQVIFSAILGFFIFGDIPDWLSIVGYVIICSMAIINFWLKSKKETTA